MTYDDIALRSGVSKATVSLVMRGLAKDRIPEPTRERVEKSARDLGYYPNNLIRSLQSGRTNTLALVAPPIEMEYVGRVIEGVRQAASELGYSILMGQSSTDAEHERVGAERLLAHRADGIIRFIRHTDSGELPAWLEEAISRGVPCVVVDDSSLAERVDCVVSDDEQGAFDVVSRLIQEGAKRVAHIAGYPGKSSARERRLGYERALNAAGLPADPSLVVGHSYEESEVDAAVAQLFGNQCDPDAIFAANDYLALRADRWLRAKGLRDKVSLAGYANLRISSRHEFLTVEQPFEEMGATAVRRLLARIDNPSLPLQTVRIPTTVVPVSIR